MKTQELLGLLQKSEAEQAEWLFNNRHILVDLSMDIQLLWIWSVDFKVIAGFGQGICGLAFELRDKAVKKNRGLYHKAMEMVFDVKFPDYKTAFRTEAILQYFALCAEPFEILVASMLVLVCEDFGKETKNAKVR